MNDLFVLVACSTVKTKHLDHESTACFSALNNVSHKYIHTIVLMFIVFGTMTQDYFENNSSSHSRRSFDFLCVTMKTKLTSEIVVPLYD